MIFGDRVPRAYQWTAAYYLAEKTGALCGLSPGLGKTLSTLMAWGILLEDKIPTKRVLVLVPPTLRDMWKKEIKAVLGIDAHIYQGRVRGGYENLADYPVVIAHYGQMRGTSRKNVGPLTKPIMAHQWDLVILDEVHAIKNRKSQRTKMVKALNARRLWGLSGTLIAEFPHDLWSLLNWVAPKEFRSFWQFVNNYCQVEEGYGRGNTYKKIVGVLPGRDVNGNWSTDITLNVLKERIKHLVIMMNYEDVGVELPPVSTYDVELTMDEDQAKKFDEIKTETIIRLTTELGDPDVWDLTSQHSQLIIKNAAVRFGRLLQVSSAPTVFFPGVSNAKLEWLENYLDEGGKPAVIMTRFKHSAEMITELLEAKGAKDFIVGTYHTLAEGHNLQHLDTLIAWDPSPSRKMWEQARHRIERLGQTRPCTIYRLSASTSDQSAWRAVDFKETEVQMINSWLRRELHA